jgi:glycosyltransferase involved in cell wall biosynthesis
LPDIVDRNETGFLVDSAEEMTEMVSRVDGLSRALCRERALVRFDSGRMIEDYLTLYRQIITRRFSAGRAPQEKL